MRPSKFELLEHRDVSSGTRARRSPPTRRDFLKGGVAAIGSAAVLTHEAYARDLIQRLNKQRVVRPASPPSTFDRDLLALVNRTSFGFSKTTYDEAAALGYDDYLESQLDYESIDDSDLDSRLEAYPTLTMTSQEIRDAYDNDTDQYVPTLELMSAALERGAYSKRQLFERMVAFWTDHFNIDILDGFVIFLKTADDRDVIRQHAMTTFPELLNASAHSAAMLFYLDNYTNIVGHAQENYARELMELHTVGVTGPYTQLDVEEVARCLTGWTIYDTPNFGEFAFHPPFHDYDSKVVLGETIAAGGGESDGLTVLDMLAYHPATAEFISRRLCRWFLGYNPPEDIVAAVSAKYMATGGDIKEMLRVILRQPILMYRATPKLKRPLHQLLSMIRASNAEAQIGLAPNYPYLGVLLRMGQVPFYWPAPDGYPDALEAWGSSQLPRWLAASWLFDGVLPATMDLDALLDAEGGNRPGEQGGAINRILTGGMMSTDEVDLLQQFYDDVSDGDALALSDTFGLAASMPGAQWY
ncbi:MAG: DUF1800 domain-containing protein [Phycisphaerae bacterium]|jgi:uncharacterized protein (DUF1800 family)